MRCNLPGVRLSLELERYFPIELDHQVLNIHDDLIARCKAGDGEAFHRLYKLYAKSMYNVSVRIIGREEEAEDAVQEAFISAFKNLDRYRAESTFGAWLKQIVVNKSINVLKKKREQLFPEDENWDVMDEEQPDGYADDLTVERVKRAIEELPDGYRAVVSLYLLEGYDHQEIAEILGITESTSKSQLNRAKARIRTSLKLAI